MKRRISAAVFLPALLLTHASPPLAAEPGEEATELVSTVTLAAVPVSSGTERQTAPVLTPAQTAVILGAMKRLSALSAKGSLLGEKELGAALSETAALDGRLSSILGPDILREIEEREKAEVAVSHLRRVRGALIAYYAAHEGEYPDDPSELVPGYLDAMPVLELPGHPATAGISAHKGPAREVGEAVSDSGGWLYFPDKASPYFGMIVLNCSHKDHNGREFYRY